MNSTETQSAVVDLTSGGTGEQMKELKLRTVAHHPHGTWVETPNDWPTEAWAVFYDELIEPFGRAEYQEKRAGVFFKDWDPSEIAEESAGLLREAGIEAKVSVTILDAENPAFCCRMTVTCDSDGIDLVEVEPVGDRDLEPAVNTISAQGN